jgi:cell wall-associated NlpC family hydrolase
MGELEILARAHELFAGEPAAAVPDARDAGGPIARLTGAPRRGGTPDGYRRYVDGTRIEFRTAADTDDRIAELLRGARADHAAGRDGTARILAAARRDQPEFYDSPVAQREALRRRVQRLRDQYRLVARARRRSRRRAALLRALRYRARRRVQLSRLRPPGGAAERAVRAAMSKLGRPYVWGAEGPDSFDCSGLVQWAYHQAGINLDRTTYDQINAGAPVPRSAIRPGDLVFPHTGHVQIAIGNGMVIEAPYSGANVRISPLGSAIAIRRPG